MTDRERWLVNFYRNSELHGALLMGRLARTIGDPGLIVEMTAHCATEARHAAMLSRALVAACGHLDPAIAPIQQHYAEAGGVPSALVDILVLSETLERRVRASYQRHLAEEATDPGVGEVPGRHPRRDGGKARSGTCRLDRGGVESRERRGGQRGAAEVAGGRFRRRPGLATQPRRAFRDASTTRMTSPSITRRVIRIVGRAAMVPESTVTPETPLASLGIGSLEQIECVMAVEEEFQVELEQPELWQTRTVQDVIDAVSRATAARPPSA